MFVDTSMVLGAVQNLIAIPASSINHAPYGDSVFVVTDLKDPQGKTYQGRASAVRQDRAGTRATRSRS